VSGERERGGKKKSYQKEKKEKYCGKEKTRKHFFFVGIF
jgi:hypothetical protein